MLNMGSQLNESQLESIKRRQVQEESGKKKVDEEKEQDSESKPVKRINS
jgi:hypothetical protein